MNRMAREFWVDVAVFEEANDAQVLKACFKQKRIEARTQNDKILRVLMFSCPPRMTYRVQVRHGFYKCAMDSLKVDPRMLACLEKAIRCPVCGSLRVEYPQMTRKSIGATLLLHLGTIFHVIEHGCSCEDCHHIWNLPPKLAPQVQRPASN